MHRAVVRGEVLLGLPDTLADLLGQGHPGVEFVRQAIALAAVAPPTGP